MSFWSPRLFSLAAGIALAGTLCVPALPSQAPPARPPAAPAADVSARLQQLLDEVTRLDPKAPDSAARMKAILAELIRVNQALARENAALRERPATSRAPAPVRKPAGGPVVLFGKRGLTKYHRTGCRSGDRIREADRIVFSSPAAATAAGYEACRICRPESAVPAPASKP